MVTLKEKKKKILENVMETETYKVAKQILDKFGDEQKKPIVTKSFTCTPKAGESGMYIILSATILYIYLFNL